MGIFLDTVNRRFLAGINIMAILTIGPCSVFTPVPVMAQ